MSADRLRRFLAVLGSAIVLAACAPDDRPPPLPQSGRAGELLLASVPGGARVSVNGEPHGNTPAGTGEVLAIPLPPGTHTIEAVLEVDEFTELFARHDGLAVGEQPLPTLVLELRPRFTAAGETRHEARQAVLAERERVAVARFVEEFPGTVTDTVSGLMWMRCSAGQEWRDGTCAGTAARYNWERAGELAANADLGGYRDWRLPTRDELFGLVWCSSGQRYDTDPEGSGGACAGDFRRPPILAEVFPATPQDKFWTGTPASQSFAAWGVAFTSGVTGVGNRRDTVLVRLVRNAR
ncbi:Lcl domain-containing protein [Pseudothauera lacus]|nr:DUF1566 domain-containing protein [Pseudothauera lacus]